MKNFRLLLILACVASVAQAAAPSSPGAATSRYLVLSHGHFDSDFQAKVSALGGRVAALHDGAGFAVVEGIPDASSLASLRGVAQVQPDLTIQLDSPIAAARAEAPSEAPMGASRSAANPAGAGRYSWQWNMRDIHADAAWSAGMLGDASVTAAILDTGIDYDAPDLAGRVDLGRSRSFIASDDALTTAYFPARNPITDYNGHGTNVATQVSSNAVALAGVTSRTTLIGVKVLSAEGKGALSAILQGVLWAADQGADVANMSLGGGFAKAGNGRYVGLINQVFNYATSHGMLIVVAAGNDGADLDHDGNFHADFCAQPGVVCVSAVGPRTAQDSPDTPAFFTNYGRSEIDVAGPGGNALLDDAGTIQVSSWPWGWDIASWVWSYCSKDMLAGFDSSGAPVTPCESGHFLTGYVGTSQATPHVTGLAALLVAQLGHGHPAQIRSALRQSAEDLGQPGQDPFYGRGRIDVARALGL